jgi:hypothetical protein
MPKPTLHEIRKILLEEIAAAKPKNLRDGNLQQNTILSSISSRLNTRNDIELEQSILTEWHGQNARSERQVSGKFSAAINDYKD